MSSFQHTWRNVGFLVLAIVVLSGCDTLTEEPSLTTDIQLNAPLIAAKTYSFLGGPNSEHEPLIDTTSVESQSTVQSISRPPTTARSPRSKLSINQGFTETLVEKGDPLSQQPIRVERTLEIANPSEGAQNKAPLQEGISGTLNLNDEGNVDFGAIEGDAGTSLKIVIKNDTKVRMRNVSLSLSNNPDAATDFEDHVDIPDLDVDASLGTISGRGGTATATINNWDHPERALKEQVDFTLHADPLVAPHGEMTICVGGSDCIGGEPATFNVETLYFRAGGEMLRTSGSFDAFSTGRLEFGTDTFIRLDNPKLNVRTLDVRKGSEDVPHPRLNFDVFRLIYRNALTFQPSGDPLDVDLLGTASSFTGNFVDCPCNASVSLNDQVAFEDLSNNDNIQFEIVGRLASSGAPSIISVGDPVTAEDAGFPIADHLTVNWGLPDAPEKRVTIRDTTSTNLSKLEDLTDPDNKVQFNSATIQLGYTNALPLGGDLTLTLVDENGTVLKEWGNDDLRLKPAPKTEDGTASNAVEDTVPLSLGSDKQELRRISEGADIRIRIDMTQNQGAPARLRTEDTIRFHFTLETDAFIDSDR